eukprot:COSAG02_NODE_1135_length_14342_cov_6.114091_10_plen_169_part_00
MDSVPTLEQSGHRIVDQELVLLAVAAQGNARRTVLVNFLVTATRLPQLCFVLPRTALALILCVLLHRAAKRVQCGDARRYRLLTAVAWCDGRGHPNTILLWRQAVGCKRSVGPGTTERRRSCGALWRAYQQHRHQRQHERQRRHHLARATPTGTRKRSLPTMPAVHGG